MEPPEKPPRIIKLIYGIDATMTAYHVDIPYTRTKIPLIFVPLLVKLCHRYEARELLPSVSLSNYETIKGVLLSPTCQLGYWRGQDMKGFVVNNPAFVGKWYILRPVDIFVIADHLREQVAQYGSLPLVNLSRSSSHG